MMVYVKVPNFLVSITLTFKKRLRAKQYSCKNEFYTRI